MFLKGKRLKKALSDAKSILHLPRFERIFHHKARRPICIVGLGAVVMLVGASIAASKEPVSHWLGVHHIIVDTIGYFIHGAGALPAFRYIEPLWCILFGVAEEAASVIGE